jgi:hypothetical protein
VRAAAQQAAPASRGIVATRPGGPAIAPTSCTDPQNARNTPRHNPTRGEGATRPLRLPSAAKAITATIARQARPVNPSETRDAAVEDGPHPIVEPVAPG